MCSLIKSYNSFTNFALFPASYSKASYDTSLADEGVQLRYIPVISYFGLPLLICLPRLIPLIVVNTNEDRVPSSVFIYFHGNGCDAGNIIPFAQFESQAFNCYYLIVEYCRYGIASGLPSEEALNIIAMSVLAYVESTLVVDNTRIVLVGRSIGTGPATYLASYMQNRLHPPAALILHSPFMSIRHAAGEWVGPISNCMLDRWQNWKLLCGDGNETRAIRSPVLFLHADSDLIINRTHSVRMHRARLAAGYPSTLFMQTSTATMVKGHNLFDFEEDYVFPCRAFLQSLLPTSPLSIPQLDYQYRSTKPDILHESNALWINKIQLGAQWLACPASMCLECGLGCFQRALSLFQAYFNPDSVSEFDNAPDWLASQHVTDNLAVIAAIRVLSTGSLMFDLEDREPAEIELASSCENHAQASELQPQQTMQHRRKRTLSLQGATYDELYAAANPVHISRAGALPTSASAVSASSGLASAGLVASVSVPEVPVKRSEDRTALFNPLHLAERADRIQSPADFA